FGVYVTEEQGSSVKILATSMWLRYGILWKPVQEVIEWLRVQANEPDYAGRYKDGTRIAVMGDDGEKFGMWPGTYEHAWKSGWVDDFFSAIEDKGDVVETITPGEAVQRLAPVGRIYLPTASYDEMGEWAMPPDSAYLLPQLKHQLERDNRTDLIRF